MGLNIYFDNNEMTIDLDYLDKLLSCKSKLKILKEDILSYEKIESISHNFKGIKKIGFHAFGHWKGTFKNKNNEVVFYDVSAGEPAILINLKRNDYQKIIISLSEINKETYNQLIDFLNR